MKISLAHGQTLWVSPTEVTNQDFAAFVQATGYRTEAELGWPNKDTALPPGSIAWNKSSRTFEFLEGSSWRYPEGRNGPSWEKQPLHPVRHVSLKDAQAFAQWKGGRLPTESEWEQAAGRLDKASANTWQGLFPHQDKGLDGFRQSTAPVAQFLPNKNGLFDMAGNVWEWTWDGADGSTPVLKGGSYLCAPNWCQGYQAAQRMPSEPHQSFGHVGFRLVWDLAPGME